MDVPKQMAESFLGRCFGALLEAGIVALLGFALLFWWGSDLELDGSSVVAGLTASFKAILIVACVVGCTMIAAWHGFRKESRTSFTVIRFLYSVIG